ncbi:MAG: GntR family transcriptional regulator [Cryobacterium sp.]|nr:GntR family transcriptional regulator [Cryobacterium sp.]
MTHSLASVTVDPSSPTPPFEQVRQQVLALVSAGALAAGTRLPTVRALAQELGIAANTAARAYRELESGGIIETRGRNGTFVAPHGDIVQRHAQEAAAAFAVRIRQLGVDPEQGLALVTAALRAITAIR